MHALIDDLNEKNKNDVKSYWLQVEFSFQEITVFLLLFRGWFVRHKCCSINQHILQHKALSAN